MSVVVARGALLSDRDLAVAVTALELLIRSMRANGLRSGPAFDLLEQLRRAHESCATQPAQLAPAAEVAESLPTDLIDVRKAAELMATSQSNVRQRCNRGSLWAIKHGREWRLSLADVLDRGLV